MDFRLELVVVPVSDVDRAKAFYADQMGFTVDVDHQPNEQFRVVQLTPPGSACSITIGIGLTPSSPGSYHGLHLVVTDIEAARAHLVERGVDVSEPFHFGPEGQTNGVHPERADYGTFMSLGDPDGNGWLVQEVRTPNSRA
ncbi:MAG TPA: VOC family protein [Candidatus Limnocylindria bacterium]|nr:VOC family protein [Candidatus Limnocylindria bacterium]